MAEPHASTAAGIAIGAGISLTGGTVFGAQIDALLIGLFAAIFVSVWLPAIDDRIKAASAVAFSALMAGYGSPVAMHWLVTSRTGFHEDDPLRLFLALTIGAVAPTVVPASITWLRATIKSRTPT